MKYRAIKNTLLVVHICCKILLFLDFEKTAVDGWLEAKYLKVSIYGRSSVIEAYKL